MLVGDEDGAAGQLWIYHGTKTGRGDAFDRAGLTNGAQSIVRVGGGPQGAPGVRAAIAAAADHKVRFDLTDVDWRQSGGRPERRGGGRGPLGQPHRARRLRPPQPERLHLRDDRRRGRGHGGP